MLYRVWLITLLFPISLIENAQAQRVDVDRLDRIEEDLHEAQVARDQFRAEIDARNAETSGLRTEIARAGAALVALEKETAELVQVQSELGAQIDILSERLDEERADLLDVLAALQSLERGRPPAIAVTPDDASTAARATMLLADAAPTLSDRAKRIAADMARLDEMRAESRARAVEIDASQQEIAGRVAVLEDLLRTSQTRKSEAERALGRAQNHIADLAATAEDLRELINSLERLARRATPRLKPDTPPGQPEDRLQVSPAPTPDIGFAEARGNLRAPIAGRVVQSFGERIGPGRRSEGIRFAPPDGATAIAPFDGRVIFARGKKPIGNVLILDVGGGYHLVFVGFERFLTQEGQLVLAGEPLGAMALETAPASTPDLYLEIRRDRRPIDPRSWFADLGRSAG